jgi:methylenetetrahydrofolate reductase (NADPH)
MKLFKTSLRIGVGESARFARKQSSLAGRLLRSNNYRPDSLVLELASKIEDRNVGIDGLYLFSFNQVKDTVAWREDMLRRLA